MDIGKDVLLGYTGGMALYISSASMFDEFYKSTNLSHVTNLYLLADYLILSLIN